MPALEKRQTSLTPVQAAHLAARYEAGATIRELAAQTGAHRETVVRDLVRAGVRLRRSGLTGGRAETAKRRYLEGSTLIESAADSGVAASTSACLLRQDVLLRPAARPDRVMTLRAFLSSALAPVVRDLGEQYGHRHWREDRRVVG